MRCITRILRNGESGQVIIPVLIILLMCELTTPPLLSFMENGLDITRTEQERMHELYSADAGIVEGIWNFTTGSLAIPVASSHSLPQSSLNSRTVDVLIERLDDIIYKITSTATTGASLSTTITSHVTYYGDFSSLLTGALSTLNDVSISIGSTVDGDVQYGGNLDNNGSITGDVINETMDYFPTTEQLSTFYWKDVEDGTVINESSLDIGSGTPESPYLIGPAYTTGDLTIKGSGVARLDGTLYVQGTLIFLPGNTLILNNQAIYAEGDLELRPGNTVMGSGSIIAEGDIDFSPNIDSSPDDFILVLSLEGSINANPGGSFYGSLVAAEDINLQPNCEIYWSQHGSGLHFPWSLDGGENPSGDCLVIESWNIGK